MTFKEATRLGEVWGVIHAAGLGAFDSLHDQQQQIFVVTDLNTSPKWEINIVVGVGATAGTDHLIVKGILGRRFDWGRHSEIQ